MSRYGNEYNNIGYTFSGLIIILMLFIPFSVLFLIYFLTAGTNGAGLILVILMVIIGAIVYFTTKFIESKIEKKVEKIMIEILNNLDK